jgi:hypothetical protein
MPLARSGAQWREPRSVALMAELVVLADNGDGSWSFMTRAEAAALGGPVAELVEDPPGSGTYVPMALGTGDPASAIGTGVQMRSVIQLVLPEGAIALTYAPGDALPDGATFTRAEAAAYLAEVPDLVFSYGSGDAVGTFTRSTTATYTAEV